MRISARVDYAVRAATELAAAGGGHLKGEVIASAQDIPHDFLEQILGELRQAGIVRSHRGARGGYRLARPAAEVTVADVIRAVEGPLASVRGEAPESLDYRGLGVSVQELWFALRANLRAVTEHVTLAELAAGTIPPPIAELAADPDARRRRSLRLT